MDNHWDTFTRVPTKRFLTYWIKKEACEKFMELHPKIREEVLRFTPKAQSRKSYLHYYKRFLLHLNKIDLITFGFYAEEVNSPNFGQKTFYKTPAKESGWDSWAEIFEGIHIGVL